MMATRGSTAEQARGWSPHFERRAAQWEQSAALEQRIAAILDQLPVGYVVFHDLQLPQPSAATVDHLVVSRQGVWVVDARYLTQAVTVGRGRSSDTLWAGRTSLRSALEASDWAADTVGRLLERNVEPVMCLITPSLPESSFEFNGIRICGPDTLATQLLTPTGDPGDVDDTVAAIRRVFDAEPSEPNTPPMYAHASGRRTEVAPYPARRVTVGARIHAIRRSVGFRVTVLVALGAASVVFFSTGLSALHAATDGASAVVSAIAGDDASGDTPSTAPDANADAEPGAPLPMRFVATCPDPGGGWELGWVWPGDLPANVAGYGIRIETADGESHTAAAAWSEPSSIPKAFRLDGIRPTTLVTDHVAEDGSIIGSTRRPFPSLGADC